MPSLSVSNSKISQGKFSRKRKESSDFSRFRILKMAILSISNNNCMLSLKILLISTFVLSLAIALKLSVPVIVEFVFSQVPIFYNTALLWLKPPYLYILINGIIISIVASSKLQQVHDSPPPVIPPAEVDISADYRMDYSEVDDAVFDGYGDDAIVAPPKVLNVKVLESNFGDEMDAGDEAVLSMSMQMPQINDSIELLISKEKEKPPLSVRFGQRKAVKPSPEGGKALGVSKPKRQDTLESTWKKITEGRAVPLSRHLKKSDTWGSHVRSNPQTYEITVKSEMFPDSTSTTTRSSVRRSWGSGRMRRQPSPSQDELNRRVEAFIKKFNEEMRVQRQESLNQYEEMINRGAHIDV